MDATTTFVLALVAIVVSGVSALASFVAIGQAARYHPKPFFQAEVGFSRGERPTFSFVVANYGNASGRDVQLTMRNLITGEVQILWREVELPPSEPTRSDVSLVTGNAAKEITSAGGRLHPEGDPREYHFAFDLTWRQWPGVKRLRRMRWRVQTNEKGRASINHGRERGWLTQAFIDMWQGVLDAYSDLWSAFRGMF